MGSSTRSPAVRVWSLEFGRRLAWSQRTGDRHRVPDTAPMVEDEIDQGIGEE